MCQLCLQITYDSEMLHMTIQEKKKKVIHNNTQKKTSFLIIVSP